MRVERDNEANAMYVYLYDDAEKKQVVHTRDLGEGVLVDVDEDGRPIGVDIML